MKRKVVKHSIFFIIFIALFAIVGMFIQIDIESLPTLAEYDGMPTIIIDPGHGESSNTKNEHDTESAFIKDRFKRSFIFLFPFFFRHTNFGYLYS